MKEWPQSVACSYCGLPLPSGSWFTRFRRARISPAVSANRQCQPHDSSSEPSQPAVYCCSGCRFAAEVTAESRSAKAINRPVARLGIAVFLTVNVVMFTMVLWSDDVYSYGTTGSVTGHSLAESPLNGDALKDTFRWLSLLLTSGVVWLLAGTLALNAWQEVRRGVAAVDLLLLSGVAAAYGYSCLSVIRGTGHLYFEVTCLVLVLVTLGRWLESLGKIRAAEAIESLIKLLPPQVVRLTSDSEEIVPLEALRRGDRIRALPGQRIAADGRVHHGSAYVDEQLITGESRCVVKDAGHSVVGGTLNIDGPLIIEVACDHGHGTVERMVDALRQGRLQRGRYQRFADRAAAWFLPAAGSIAVAAILWHARQSTLEDGVLAALAVLLIACPCALGIATPLAIWTAIGRASAKQVLVRNGDALERLASVRTIIFDKTGTLSSGSAMASRLIVADGESGDEILQQAWKLSSCSVHPYSVGVAQFVVAALPTLQVVSQQANSLREYPGKGLAAIDTATGQRTLLGSQLLMDEMGLLTPPSLLAQIEQRNSQLPAWVMIGWDGRVRGAFLIDEQIRPEAKSAVAELQHMGFNLLVLSGDGQQRANDFSRSIGIPVRGGLLPSDKVAAINAVRRRRAGVAMVGDGLNDAVALAAADVGIALACGCDVSREAADICLLGNDLSRIPWIIRLARNTVKVIRQNLFWAFAYNSIGIAMAVMGTLNPIWAAVAMTFSSFFVVANSLRLGVSSEATNLVHSAAMNNKHIDATAPLTSEASDFRQWVATDLVKTN